MNPLLSATHKVNATEHPFAGAIHEVEEIRPLVDLSLRDDLCMQPRYKARVVQELEPDISAQLAHTHP